MKLLSAITIAAMALAGLFAPGGNFNLKFAQESSKTKTVTTSATEEISDFEKAVQLIKKYEGLHQPRHYPLVGYGHLVLPGEKFSRTKAMNEAEAEKLLRKDLLKNCAVFRDWGADSLILGVLAYNIGSGNALRSSVAKKLKAGDRDIYANYVAHSKYKGKTHTQIRQRRIEEYETLFIKNANEETADTPMPLPESQNENAVTAWLGASFKSETTVLTGIVQDAFDMIGDMVKSPVNTFYNLASSKIAQDERMSMQSRLARLIHLG